MQGFIQKKQFGGRGACKLEATVASNYSLQCGLATTYFGMDARVFGGELCIRIYACVEKICVITSCLRISEGSQI